MGGLILLQGTTELCEDQTAGEWVNPGLGSKDGHHVDGGPEPLAGC